MDLLVLIHGITPHDDELQAKADVQASYARFLANLDRGLRAQGRSLDALFPKANILPIFWGLPHGGFKQDLREMKLSQAETSLQAMTGADRDGWKLNPLSGLLRRLKKGVISQGLADAVYYASAQGEPLVRLAVFGQILQAILPRVGAKGSPVRLHVVCHSLGVTVAHDLLFHLFNRTRGYRPKLMQAAGLKSDRGTKKVQRLLEVGRAMAGRGQLRLGSYHALASQLSLFSLRKAHFIPGLAEGRPYFELAKIGVKKKKSEGVQAQFFYDPSDLLGFPSLGLYKDKDREHYAREFRVWNWAFEGFYHTGYWGRGSVGRRVAEVVALRGPDGA